VAVINVPELIHIAQYQEIWEYEGHAARVVQHMMLKFNSHKLFNNFLGPTWRAAA
jgi:hypothetical protein